MKKKANIVVDNINYNAIPALKWGTMFEPMATRCYSKKMNNRLYGTKLLVQSPHILELDKEPYIIVKNGSYDKEISEQILEINPKAKIFTY